MDFSKNRFGWPPSSFFAPLPSEFLESLLAGAELVGFAPDEVVIEKGALDDDVFLLLSSYVR